MAVELVTGHAGSAHVSGDDVGHLLSGIFGRGKFLVGDAPTVTMVDANTVSISACDLLLDGRHVRLTGITTSAIANGVQNAKRADLVCVRYTRDSGGTEAASVVVIQGTAGKAASDPALEYPASVLDGAMTADYAIVRVTLDWLTPTAEWLVHGSASTARQAVAYIESATTASRAYAAGEYFVRGGLLFVATKTISKGGAFTTGTNCRQVTGGAANNPRPYELRYNNGVLQYWDPTD